MADQARFEPYEESDFFDRDQSALHPVEGTIARGELVLDEPRITGMEGGEPVAEIPVPVDMQLLQRGQSRFNIFCSPCHGRLGTGRGMVVRRGFPPARNFHTEQMRQAPAGHYFAVIEDGYRDMPSYASQVPPMDRWAIIAYIRALQLSQAAPVAELPEEDRQRLNH